MTLDLRVFGGSPLTADLAVPTDRTEGAMTAGIPVTYVPGAEHHLPGPAGVRRGDRARSTCSSASTRVDYSGYPDCRPEFVRAFERWPTLATKAGVEGGRFQHPRAADRPDESRHHPPAGPRWASTTR
ncbi:MAG: 7-cyano-7-deazaguanine synthase [Gemmataceae bacterium]